MEKHNIFFSYARESHAPDKHVGPGIFCERVVFTHMHLLCPDFRKRVMIDPRETQLVLAICTVKYRDFGTDLIEIERRKEHTYKF
jgi:hypothetical protein